MHYRVSNIYLTLLSLAISTILLTFYAGLVPYVVEANLIKQDNDIYTLQNLG